MWENHLLSRWWEKYFSKGSLVEHTCSWRDKLLVLAHYWFNKPPWKTTRFFEGKRKRHYKKQATYSESSSGDTKSEYYIPKKGKTKKKITKKYKRYYDVDDEDDDDDDDFNDDTDSASESNEESDNFDDDDNDNINYKKKSNKRNKKTKK